ncbi:MAG: hypothetical protein ABH822_00415 [Patescibacteria group bacterium]
MLKGNNYRLNRDLALIGVSAIFAVFIWQNNYIDQFIASLSQGRLVSAFIAGFFFTSAFTTPPAIAFLVKLAQFNSIFLISLIGAAGAVLGDSIIFYFVRDRLFDDILCGIKKSRKERIMHLFKSKIIRFSMALTGGLLVALPLFPDEIALAIIGMSKATTRVFIMVTFLFNFLAIFLLSLAGEYF